MTISINLLLMILSNKSYTIALMLIATAAISIGAITTNAYADNLQCKGCTIKIEGGKNTITVTGTPGQKGDTGSQGPAGNDGAQGVPGVQGEQGIQGIQGEQGVQGPPGQNATVSVVNGTLTPEPVPEPPTNDTGNVTDINSTG